MNRKLFLRITILAILVLFTLVIFRLSLDEVEMGPTLRFIDSVAGRILPILCFPFIIPLFLFGKDLQSPIYILALSLVAIGIIWGFIIERIIYLIKKGSGRG